MAPSKRAALVVMALHFAASLIGVHASNASNSSVTALPCNVTDGIKEPNYFTPIFYDMECLKSLDTETVECPVDMADEFVSHFASDLRIESTCLILIQFFCMVCMLQTASIPAPVDNKGTLMWWVWMLLQTMQLVFTMLSLVSVLLSFGSAASLLGTCAVRFRGWVPLINASAFMSAWFHPAVAALAGAVCLSADALLQGVKTCSAANQDSDFKLASAWQCVWLILLGSVAIIVCVFALAPLALTTMMYVLSASFAFGLPIFGPLALATIICFGLTGVVMFGVGLGMASLLPGKANVMLWWVSHIYGHEWKGNGFLEKSILGSMILVIRITLALLLLSPLIVWGTWLALYVYNGATTDQVGAMIAEIYAWIFDVLVTAEFALPNITLDPTLVTEAFEALGDVANFARVPPLRLLQGCRALSSLSALLATMKLPLTGISLLRDRWSGITKTVSYAAIANAPSGVFMHELCRYEPEATLFGKAIRVEPEVLS